MNFRLSKFVIPSVISMVLVGTYTNIDGFFIGNVTGDDGLTAINIVWPIVAFITSLGTGIGVGGSVILNQMRGRKEHDAAEQIKATMIFLLAAVGIAASILFKLTYKPLLVLMECTGTGPFVCCRLCRYYRYRCSIPGDGIRACCRSPKRTEDVLFNDMLCGRADGTSCAGYAACRSIQAHGSSGINGCIAGGDHDSMPFGLKGKKTGKDRSCISVENPCGLHLPSGNQFCAFGCAFVHELFRTQGRRYGRCQRLCRYELCSIYL